MNRRSPWQYLVALILFAVTCTTYAQSTAKIVILHVNDSHGQTLGRNVDGKSVGGYPRLASYVAEVRKQEGKSRVLLIHAGDEFSRGDDLTARTGGQANVAIMNELGFSLWTPGNGEFYLGSGGLLARLAEAKFVTLNSNITLKTGNERIGVPTHIKTVDNVRLGFMGMCFIRTELPNSRDMVVADPIKTSQELVPLLRKQADVVVAVNHIGFVEDRRLAEAVPGIDLIVGGHSHTTLPQGHTVRHLDGSATLIAQAGEHLRYVGRIDLQLAKIGETWTITSATSTLVPLDQSIPEDPTIKAKIASLWPKNAATRPAIAVPSR